MHRIDGPGAAPGGFFRAGDPSTGTPATTVTPEWCNSVQDEIAHVVEAAGIALDKTDNSQLLEAINALVLLANPVGSVIEGYFLVAPSGYALLTGQLVNREGVFARLWAHVQGVTDLVVSDAAWLAGAFGMFSSGDGATTFRLPRLGGQHTRALDNGANVDPGRTLGSLQSDDVKSHTHQYRGATIGAGGPDPSGVGGTFQLGATSATGIGENRVKTVALNKAIRI